MLPAGVCKSNEGSEVCVWFGTEHVHIYTQSQSHTAGHSGHSIRASGPHELEIDLRPEHITLGEKKGCTKAVRAVRCVCVVGLNMCIYAQVQSHTAGHRSIRASGPHELEIGLRPEHIMLGEKKGCAKAVRAVRRVCVVGLNMCIYAQVQSHTAGHSGLVLGCAQPDSPFRSNPQPYFVNY